MAKATKSVAEIHPGVAASRGSSRFADRPLRSLALLVGLPALLFYGLSAALVYLALSGMAAEINRQDDRRNVASIHAALDSFLSDLGGAVSDEGTWSEAYLNVVVQPDPAWMDTTWGATARLGTTYDDVLVTTQAGDIVFGENAVGAITGKITERYASADRLLHDLDQGIAATGDATAISHFAANPDGTAVGIAAISIHQTTPGEMTVPRESRRVLWLVRQITPALLQDIAVRYQTPLPALVNGVTDGDADAIEITDADGRAVATLAWHSERPGDTAFGHAALVATAVFAGIGALLALWLGLLRGMIARHVKVSATVAALGKATFPAPLAVDGIAAAEAALGAVANPIAGIDAADFSIAYQPIFDLRSETLIGVEALLRWTRADKDDVRQEDLPVAERTELLERAGIIALRRAADDLSPLTGLMLTCAVTPEQLRSGVYREKIAGTLAAAKMPARRLQLSVEAPLLPPITQMAMAMMELRQQGVLLAINDFAVDRKLTDYLDAGLVDRVRIVASPAGAGAVAPAHQAHLTASIEAARLAGAAVTIAGLERKEQASRMLRLGCREFQGNLLAKPLTLAALTELILTPARPAEIKQAG